MRDYRVFGGQLRSAVDFERLRNPVPGGSPDWRLEIGSSPPPVARGSELGRDRVQQGVEVGLWQVGNDLQLVYDDTGVFSVSERGDRIHWWPGDGADLEAVRMDVLGRVIPLALHLQGFLVLHASAVVVDGKTVGFVGPKRSGKSTVALALHREGARVLTDDVLVLDVRGEKVMARPGMPDLRLRRDTASTAGLDRSEDDVALEGGRTLLQLGRDAEPGPVPLSALYLLNPPAPDGPAESLAIHPLPETRAAVALVGQAKLGPLLADWDAATLLERAATVVRSATIRTLQLPRGLDRLQEAAAVLVAADRDVPTEARGAVE